MRDGEKVETSMGGDYLQLGSKLELRHNGGLCVRACVCVCVFGTLSNCDHGCLHTSAQQELGVGGGSLQAEAVSCLSCRKDRPAYSLHCVGLPKDSEFMQVETSLGTDGGSSSSTLSTQIHI